jgi:superfamily II DNA or RNA helicase
MAVRVKLDLLSEQQKETIRKLLYFQPKRTNFVANKFSYVEKDPVLSYIIDKPNNEIILPYFFANILFQKNLNSERAFPPGNFEFKGQLRENQIGPVNEALKQLDEFGTTMLSLPTGFGKSICSSYLASKCLSNCGGLVLVITPRETIQMGFEETFKKETTAGVWIVENNIKIPQQCNVILSLNTRVCKIPKEILNMISILILDELHMLLTAGNVPYLLATQPKYIIGCSATLKRPDEMERIAYSILGTHQVVVKNEKRFNVYKINTGIDTELVKNKQGTTDFSALVKELAFNPKRNTIIVDLVLANKTNKFMILSWSKAHISLLLDIFKKMGESVEYLAGTKSTYIDSRILLGTLGKVSTGFDAKNVAINWDGLNIDTLIMTCSTKSYNLHIQSIGRGFRSESPSIIHIVDEDKISKSHWSVCKKTYSSLNCQIHEIHMKPEEKNQEEKKEITQEELQKLNQTQVKALREKFGIN